MYILAIAVSWAASQSAADTINSSYHSNLCIDVYRAINAFVNYADIPGGPLVFYDKLNHPHKFAKIAVYSVQAIRPIVLREFRLSAFLIFCV